MSILHRRIVGEQYLDTPDYHPAVASLPTTVTVLPAYSVDYTEGQVLYGTLHPLVTADGAVVPAKADVHYPSVIPAGSP